MARKNRTPEENARREKIRELLQMANIGSMEDIQSLFKETIAEFMENGLEAELDDELGYSKYDYKNKDTDDSRNGHSSKTLRTSFGDVEVSVPRDWKGEFEPKVLKKNQTSISQDIEEKILSMYAKGMTTSDIEAHIQDIYGVEVSDTTVSRITDKRSCPSQKNGSSGLWRLSTRSFFSMPSTTMCAARGRSSRRLSILPLASIWTARRTFWVCGSVKMRAPNSGQRYSIA